MHVYIETKSGLSVNSSKLSTSAVPLSSFKDRRLPSLQKAYLNGRFGAVPIIDDIELD